MTRSANSQEGQGNLLPSTKSVF